MGLWSRVKTAYQNLRRSQPERPNGYGLFLSGKSTTGVNVNHDTALTYAAVWACTRVISESLSQMSWHVFQSVGEDNGRIPLRNHPVDWLLYKQANPEMPAFVFKRQLLTWALTWGNAYAEIERDLSGRAIWLWPIEPDRVAIDRTQSGQLIYDIYNRGQSNTVLLPSEMYHLRGVGADGIQGYSVISMAKQSIGLGLAADGLAAATYGQGMTAQGGFKMPGKLSNNARDNLTKSIDERWLGQKNWRRPILMEEGLEWQNFSMSMEDAEFLASRKFQVVEICRWFRVPPHKIAELDRATFNNIEWQSIEFVVDTCVPWAVQMEQEADLKLFGTNRQNLFTKLNVSSLMRGDQPSRYSAYSTGRQWGWLSVNDVRRLEDMNPLPPHLGDTYLVPVNYYALPLDSTQPVLGPPNPQPPNERPPRPDNLEDTIRVLLAEQAALHRNGHAQEGPPA